MLSELIKQLDELPDKRRGAGKRHSIGVVLVLSIMATVSGMYSYHGMGDFVRANKEELLRLLGLKRLPSYSTIRRVIMAVPTDELSYVLGHWNRSSDEQGKILQWAQVDGKAIKATVEDYGESNQDFVNVVSLFFGQQRKVIASASFHNKEESEIKVVRQLIEKEAQKGLVYTADAIHAQKKL
ncbi:MAG: ISAs1 family transposase [Hymenobacteraceae bacterium]|mgnify:CR=1 FL=1|nr:ISAs1 family transposase [Hymenobacteraceae bacterium]